MAIRRMPEHHVVICARKASEGSVGAPDRGGAIRFYAGHC